MLRPHYCARTSCGLVVGQASGIRAADVLSWRHRDLDRNDWRWTRLIGRIDERRAARFLLAISGEDQPETMSRFDVLAMRNAGKGTATQPSGQWALADIYAQDGNPLAWTRR
jgi:hypothetical protein